jgi:hypothetical protein
MLRCEPPLSFIGDNRKTDTRDHDNDDESHQRIKIFWQRIREREIEGEKNDLR